MPTSVIALGTADLHLRESSISVELKSSAEFASSAEDAIDQLRQRLTSAYATDQGTGKPWICRGNSFKLVIALRLGEVLGTRDQDEVVQILSEQIQETKLLQQLRLTPTSVQSSVDGGSGAYTITAHLTYDDSTPSSRRRMHKLGADVPFHDVRPPLGVTEVSCEAVHVSLALGQRRHRKRKRRQAFERLDHGGCGDLEEISNRSYEEMLEESGLTDPYDGTAADDHAHLFLSESAGMMLDARFQDNANELDMSFGNEIYEPANPAMDDFARTLPESRPCDSPITSSHAAATTDGCVRAIEAALQLAICGLSRRTQSNISVDNSRSVCSLADAIPAIWSPNYIPSVASRAVFVPTIAHALESVLERATAKVEDEGLLASDAAKSQSHDVISQRAKFHGSPVQAQLWKRMQHLLHSKNATSRLSLLCEPAEDEHDGHGVLDNLLNGGEAYFDGLEMLDVEDGYGFVEDDWDRFELEDGIGDCLDDDEEAVDSDLDDGALAGNLEEGPDLDDIDSGWPYQVFDLAEVYRSSTPDELPDQAKAIATSTWQGGEFRLISPAGQFPIMPSQSPLSTGDRTSCKTKRPPAVSDSKSILWLPDEAGRQSSTREDWIFENSDSDEMLITEADMQSIPSDGDEMLCI